MKKIHVVEGQMDLMELFQSYMDATEKEPEIKGITGELYPWQKAPAKAMKRVLLNVEDKGYLGHRAFFLFGEVGVGKTYIASYIAKDWVGRLVVLAPEETHQNWKDCLALFGVTKFQLSDTIDLSILREGSPKDLLVIVDEVHKCVKNAHLLTVLERLVSLGSTLFSLTGTPFSKEANVFAKAALILANMDVPRLRRDQVSEYLRKIVPYYGISLSKPTNKASEPRYIVNSREIGIDMSVEQRAFYDFMVARNLQVNSTEYQLARATDEFVDFGDTDSFFTKRDSGKYFIGYKAKDRVENQKLVALKKLLSELLGKTLIYVNSKKALNFLKHEGLGVLEFENKLETEQLIHQFYDNNDVLVVCTTDVKEGINLNEVSNIVWYQTPKNAVDFTQCNGRMLRGIPSEDTHKQVIQIYSRNSIQEKIANRLSLVVSGNNISISADSEESWESRLKQFLNNVKSM